MDIEKDIWKKFNPLLEEQRKNMMDKLSLMPEGDLKEYMKLTIDQALDKSGKLDFKIVKENIDKLEKQDASRDNTK